VLALPAGGLRAAAGLPVDQILDAFGADAELEEMDGRNGDDSL
jgi:hypothetical protein